MKKLKATIMILLLGIASLVSGAVVDQLTPAVYVINKGSSSIGPAIRIIENKPAPSAISNISVVLTPSSNDMSCLFEKCQDQRLSEANLLPHAIDMFALANLFYIKEGTVGQNCSTMIFTYDMDNPSRSSYGEIERGKLPYDFGTGEFSFSFVATLTGQASIFLVPNATNRSLTFSQVTTAFGLRMRKREMKFFYGSNFASRDSQAIRVDGTNVEQFFDPSNAVPRHYTLVITTNPLQLTAYFECKKLKTVSLIGDQLIRPNPNSSVFIGRSQPHPNSADRLGGVIHGLYYYPMALNESQINHFCSCEFESLIQPWNLPDGIAVKFTSSKHSIHLFGTQDVIPTQAAITVLRSINYTNQLHSTELGNSTRQLLFNITNKNGAGDLSTGEIVIVNSDNSVPTIDLNGINALGTNVLITNQSPVLVSPQAVVTRNIEGFPSISPTISCVLVQLTNAVDNDYEQLSVTTTSQVLSVIATNNSQTLEIVGPGLPSEFNSVLRAILYANMKENPTTSTQRVISFLVTDTEGRRNSREAISTINLLAPEVNSHNRLDTIIGASVSAVVSLIVILLAAMLFLFLKHKKTSKARTQSEVDDRPTRTDVNSCMVDDYPQGEGQEHLYDYINEDALYLDMNPSQENAIISTTPIEAVEEYYETTSYIDVVMDNIKSSVSDPKAHHNANLNMAPESDQYLQIIDSTLENVVEGDYQIASYTDIEADNSGSSPCDVFNISENAAYGTIYASDSENDYI